MSVMYLVDGDVGVHPDVVPGLSVLGWGHANLHPEGLPTTPVAELYQRKVHIRGGYTHSVRRHRSTQPNGQPTSCCP